MRVEFRHQVTRDLAWVIASPSILCSHGKDRVSDDWCRLAFYDRIPWLRELDREPSGVLAWLEARKSRLLGVYFELLIEYWLSHWRRMALQASRLPLMGVDRSIGEFDFLFRDRFLDIDYHWETAVKFFLRYRHNQAPDEWLGPNPRDTLPSKYNKVFSHQLILSAMPEAQAVLRRLGIASLQPKAFFKGYLFEHIGDGTKSPQTFPPDISPDHLTGWWCHYMELGSFVIGNEDHRWVSLMRLHWLSPVYSREILGMSLEECLAMIDAHFDGSTKPLLLAELKQGSDGIWREVSRGFIVADHWPSLRQHGGDTILSHD